MNGDIVISDLMGRVYWRTDDVRDAYQEALVISAKSEDTLLVVQRASNGRTVYVKDGTVSLYVKNGSEYDVRASGYNRMSGGLHAR